MRNFYLKIFNFFSVIYLYIFGRKIFYCFNQILLKLALKSIGYQNFGDHRFTGERNFIRSIKKFNPKICLDIGAHTGSYSSLLIKELNCKVISFEANKFSFDKLKNLKGIYKDHLDIFNYAVTNKNKKVILYYGSKLSQLASLNKNLTKINFIKNSNKNKKIVKGITIDTFFKKNFKKLRSIDLIKIDTEGHEYEVLEGAKKTITRLKPNFIQIEFNWHQLYKNKTLLNFHQLLINYDLYRILPLEGSIIKIDPHRPENNIFHLSNIVFVKKGIDLEK
jgi:FkbM family methyltransferase